MSGADFRPSPHLINDRMERYVFIATEIGFGEIVAEHYNPACDRWSLLSDTGITFIVDGNKETCITLYIVDSFEELTFICGGNVPKKVKNAFKKNQKFFYKNH